MTDFRSFAVRAPTALTGRQISNFGIHSHPPAYQSARFKKWLGYCQANDGDTLASEVRAFLSGNDSVKKIHDLGDGWANLIQEFVWHGSELTKAAALEIVRRHHPDALIGRDGRVAGHARTATADTMVGLAYLKRLGAKGNVDQQTVLRTMAFVERAVALRFDLPEASVIQHFTRPILLPHEFFQLDPCKAAPTGDRKVLPLAPGRGHVRAKVDPCDCKDSDECVDQGTCCATITPCIVDLMIVRDYTKCYRAGDLSYIKNVLAGETLKTINKRLERTEQLSEMEESRTQEAERDLQTEEKSGLSTEIDNTIKNDMSLNSGVTFNAQWGVKVGEVGARYDVTATTNLAASQSKDSARKEARNYSKDVLDRSITKLEDKVRTLQRTTRLVENSETNVHKFSNAEGPNIAGQYLYVNKVSRAQMYNHGKKAAIDIYLPEPAELYIKLLENKFEGVEPKAPEPLTITPAQILPSNYTALADKHALKDVAKPPVSTIDVDVWLSGSPSKSPVSQSASFPVDIPAGYAGVSMSAPKLEPSFKNTILYPRSIQIILAGASIYHERAKNTNNSIWTPNPPTTTLPSIEGHQTVTVDTTRVLQFGWLLTIHCTLKPEVMTAWQTEIYDKITEAQGKLVEEYQAKLQAYQDAKATFEEKEAALRAARYNQNPFLLREIERAELKRMAISYMSCQFFDRFNAMKSRVKPCGHPQMDIREAESDGRYVQFFEQAFNWNLMTYIFYRYFWGRKSRWPDRLKAESDDPIFKQFLAAGSAHVLVPIRDGYVDLVQYFLATGEIWGGSGQPPLPNDPHYVSMAQEIKEQKDNYYADRPGRLDVVKGNLDVILNNSEGYWSLGQPNATPPIPPGVDNLATGADIDREILIDFKVYRIVAIEELPFGSTSPTSWKITLDRPYEGETADKLPWSTGALFVGAPWEFVTPTTLTFLRDKSPCLPCYPLKECKEEGQ
jgi:hypothetical protein